MRANGNNIKEKSRTPFQNRIIPFCRLEKKKPQNNINSSTLYNCKTGFSIFINDRGVRLRKLRKGKTSLKIYISIIIIEK